MARRLGEFRENYERLWFITIRAWEEDLLGRVRAVLDNIYSVAQRVQFAGVDIHSYQLSQVNRLGTLYTEMCK